MNIHFKGNKHKRTSPEERFYNVMMSNTTKSERIYNAISGTSPRTDAPKTSLGRITEALNQAHANQLNNK